ncbi:uncharacterized protein PHALS_11017 [Plasmopara halstedii]|uniref:Uncharacterized protein n=1 Tax=Plasmopara halstedii TaxID=4781 RepID=A0A0P1AHT4_PLAHL|nr:uncharacterized protein PHALS_11017 [Plasmopara halstedii]CEG40838.1 hypothetical protein PHALS_11017 [Plasmopara halstedii]|eukprot:XP_024577207.1 hypothetical protein PHALS_11017 [Plasmopara halstedii]
MGKANPLLCDNVHVSTFSAWVYPVSSTVAGLRSLARYFADAIKGTRREDVSSNWKRESASLDVILELCMMRNVITLTSPPLLWRKLNT